jgi:hypothetical protein
MDFSKLTPEQFKVAEMVVEAAEHYKIDPNLLLAQAFRESQFKQIPADDPKSDAFGVMQIRPSTAEQNKLGDIRDIRTNVFGGAKLMRMYLDQYKSPEGALLAYHQGPGVAESYVKSGGDLKAVGPKGLDYVINIGENGGFGAPPKQEGEEEPAEKSRFAGYESEASKLKKEKEENPTQTDEGNDLLAPFAGGIAGAGLNLVAPPFTNPQVPTKVDSSKAQEAHRVAQDKLDVARQQLEHYAPTGVDELEDQFHQSRQGLERLKNEQRLTQERLKQKPPQAPASVETEVPTTLEVSPRTKVGDSGAVNYVHAMSDDVPDVLANQALNMRKDNPRGGQAIIDANAQAIQKQADLGLGDYGLTRTAGGVQLALPPTTVAERQAEIDKQNQERNAELAKKAEETRLQQEEARMDEELTRAYHERELERLRQERAEMGARHNILSEQRKITTPIVRQVNKAQSDAEVAKRRLERASQQPSAVTRPLDVVGAGTAKMGAVPRTLVGGVAGFAGVMSYQEALARFKAGDTSEGVLKALEAGSAGAMLVPPATKGLQRIRGAGALGAGALGTFELGRRLLRDREE